MSAVFITLLLLTLGFMYRSFYRITIKYISVRHSKDNLKRKQAFDDMTFAASACFGFSIIIGMFIHQVL